MSNISNIKSLYISHLRNQFSNGSLVLFTGAGFSLDGINTSGENLPSTLALTKLLWDMCFPGVEFETDTQLVDIYQSALAQHKKELDKLLKKKFTVDGGKVPEWYKELMSMPWVRAYTLNIDDLLEKAQLLTSGRNAKCISAITDSPANFTDNCLDVIHLNGTINDVPEDVMFSRLQYAERTGNNPFYQQLNSDLISRPIVFIGSSLEEGAMWEHIIARGSKGMRTAKELRPRSYLVLPSLNRSKQSMLTQFNIVWLKMTGEEFSKEFLSQLEDSKAGGFAALDDQVLAGSARYSGVKYVSDLSQKNIRYTEYLMGHEPTWSDIQNKRVAIRECFNNLWDEISKVRACTSNNEIILVTGTAGVGKSSVLMWAALKLQADGLVVGWVDADNKLTRKELIDSINRAEEIGALFINDADIYGAGLSEILSALLNQRPKLLIAIEARSSKVDNIINKYELGHIHVNEHTIPNLCDSDINEIIAVLDKENRLGKLKGQSDGQRILAFKGKANRQLLVAMYEATSGGQFAKKAEDEISDLSGLSKLVYGLISTASAYRYPLARDELLIACGDATNEALNAIEMLVRRKLIHIASVTKGLYKARHRVIADISYNYLVKNGQFEPIIRGLIMIGVAKVFVGSDRNSRPSRILRTFINHDFMMRTIGKDAARNIYGKFEYALSWDSHYWLHRGALELETNHLDLAENFLNQAMSLRPGDLYIQNEWAYLLFKKAICDPENTDSKDLIDEAIKILEAIIVRRETQSAHAYHVLGYQGLRWAAIGISVESEYRDFLGYLKRKIQEAAKLHPGDEKLTSLLTSIERATLLLAVNK